MSDQKPPISAWVWTVCTIVLSLLSEPVPWLRSIAGIAGVVAIVLWVLRYRRWRARHPKTPEGASSEDFTPSTSTNFVQLRRGTGAVVAVGERYYARALRKAWKVIPDPEHITVALVPEPENPHDPNAVRLDVVIDGRAYPAGHIPREDAAGYSRALRPLAKRGLVGIGDGKIRIDSSGNFQVYARLSDDPKTLLPPQIDDPLGHFIDGVFDLVVTGEERYQETLKPHARRAYPIPFALHPTTIEKGTHQGKRTFSVYLDGEIVGQLTRAMAQKHSHTIDSVIQFGRRPYLAGRIEHDHRGLQVILDAPSEPPGPRATFETLPSTSS